MELTREEAEARIRRVGRTCRGPLPEEARERIQEALAGGHTELARRLDRDNREGCGMDFNEVVLAGPFDGEEHAYECPKCGVEGTYVAPDLTISEED